MAKNTEKLIGPIVSIAIGIVIGLFTLVLISGSDDAITTIIMLFLSIGLFGIAAAFIVSGLIVLILRVSSMKKGSQS